MRVVCLLTVVAIALGCTNEAAPTVEAPPPPVHAATLRTETIVPTSTATAEILPNREANLRAETAGRVVALEVDAGERVEEGDVLVRLDVGRPASAVRAAQAAVAQGSARLEQAERELSRTEQLVKTGGLPEQRLDDARDAVTMAAAALDAARAEARLARRGLTEAVVRAPFSGTVVQRSVELGEYLGPGSPLLTLADPSRLKARVLLDPREALDVSPGASATVTVYARPGERFEARVVRVAEVIDPGTRRLPVELEIVDADHRLRPGLVARFIVQTGTPKRVLRVPLDAVFERFGNQYVYAIEDGVAKRRPIALGAAEGGYAEVVEGAAPGDVVVSKGVTRVVDGSKVRVVPEDSVAASTEEPVAPAEP
jgi:RND family efflux transporter MFP subunit